LPPPLDAAFDNAAYEPFDPMRQQIRSLVIDPVDGSLVWQDIGPGTWARRPRPFGNLVRSDEAADETPPIVQISFDLGATWQDETRVELLETEAAIRFVPESPLDITPNDPNTGQPVKWWNDNMWYAVIEDRFRVQVTATIEDDDLVVPDYGPAQTASGGPVARRRARVIDDRRYAVMTGHRSIFMTLETGPDWTIRSDLDWAGEYADQLKQLWRDKQPAIRVTVPWLDAVPEIGQRVSGIYGIGVSVNRAVDYPRQRPQIVGIDYTLTPSQSTVPIVGDFRTVTEAELQNPA